MEIVIPLDAYIEWSAGTPSYTRTAWATSTAYTAGISFVRYQVGSVWYDYVAMVTHTSSASTAPSYATNYWRRIGRSQSLGATSVYTNVDPSFGANWTSGASVTAGTLVHDQLVRRDYVAALDLTAGENTIRPHDCQYHPDPLIAARWVDRGASNAYAPVDYGTDTPFVVSKLVGISAADAIVNPYFHVAESGGIIDRVVLVGLVNVKTIIVAVYVDGTLTETKTVSAIPSGTTYGFLKKTVSIPVTQIAADKAAVFRITLARDIATRAPEVGRVIVGRAYTLGSTQWKAETSILSFSRKERDATYGTLTLTPRPSARTLRATCSVYPSSVAGDIVQQGIEYLDGKLAFFDFNNTGTDYDRLRIFGIVQDFGIVISMPTHEVLSMTVEGIAGL